ncbi:MAG: exonuclease domain-containing protein [Verrucomicrobiales bacterium]|nr:exonuclease domain-containing protein [Verrucomicrobiales bacterium]
MPHSSQQVLDSRYYLDHFHEMLEFIRTKMADTLEETHEKFIKEFESLTPDARCLYVRFANRKGQVFRRDRLRYAEIQSIPSSLNELSETGFVRSPEETDWDDLLSLHTRPDLIAMIRTQREGNLPASLKKRDLIDLIRSKIPFESCFPEEERREFVVQEHLNELDYLFFLYYGRLSSGLTALALRDLGLIRKNPFQSNFKSRFNSREAALAAFSLLKVSASLKSPSPEKVTQLALEVESWPRLDDAESETLYHRAIYKLGRELERMKKPELALSTYSRSDQYPASERTVRLLVQTGDHEKAKAALTRMIDDPSCDAELLFAEDFYERKFQHRKVGRLTSMLREARVFTIDETNRDRPEAGVIMSLARENQLAYHTENIIWNQLFGLLFWDLLFESETSPIHNEFERKPWGLDSGVFFRDHQTHIEKRLDSLSDRETAIARIRRTWKAKEGIPNSLVPWFPGSLDLVCLLIQLAPEGSLSSLLALMAENHRSHRSGFPDLMVTDANSIRFIEVKTEGDRLSRTQMTRLEQLRRFGFPVEVGAVEWNVDPAQEYVVVDIETTGGKSQWHRVTEIGAVRVRNGRIIEEWSSLVNPNRRIPKSIVSLTGITDEMVADAPRFEAIADEFRAFVGDAVFVAHRAAFDYTFLRTEYERLGQEFQCPTLCTVVASRRVFPGLKSYGLANLSRDLGVSLDSHHRALCDARATAEILILINERRMEMANC